MCSFDFDLKKKKFGCPHLLQKSCGGQPKNYIFFALWTLLIIEVEEVNVISRIAQCMSFHLGICEVIKAIYHQSFSCGHHLVSTLALSDIRQTLHT